jgi:serine/threonine protein kinase
MTDVIPPDALPPSEPVDSAEARTVRSDDENKPRVEEPPLPPSTKLAGRYLIVHELGRGGMGIVYRALDQWLGRQVALKVLKRGRAEDEDDDTTVRFLDEARLTAKLQHPAIVPVFDLGQTDDGRAFYTMRLVEGRTLADLAAAGWTRERHEPGRLTLFRALEVFAQACQAVGFAHDRGFVHRDLKPANVMVGRFGEVHVLDWGLAKQTGWRPELPPLVEAVRGAPEAEVEPRLTTRDLTKSGTVMGTPAYMAPEQATGQPLDPRADVYALGGTLYTLLTGKLPHEGTSSEVMWRVTWGIPPTPPSGLTGDIPAALDAICLRALAHERDHRHENALVLAAAIEGFLEGRPAGPVNPEDAEFLRSYRPAEFRRPSLTVDIVVLHAPPGAGAPRAFLHRRVRSPFKGRWAIPGSFVRLEDDLETAARRTLFAETGIGSPDLKLEQLGAFGAPDRDPRTRVVTVAYLAVLDDAAPPPVVNAEDEADTSAWFELEADGAHDVRLRGPDDDAPEPAFDHGAILAAALRRWRARRG